MKWSEFTLSNYLSSCQIQTRTETKSPMNRNKITDLLFAILQLSYGTFIRKVDSTFDRHLTILTGN